MLAASLLTIKTAALALRSAGRNGFEGLAGHLLATWSGHPMRASRSGNQFGHDGGTGSNPFSILYEAKQYHASKVDLRELQGELVVAAQNYPDLDLYVVVSSQALGDGFEVPLSRQADGLGAEILMLDWEGVIPPLAAFIAGHPIETASWIAANLPSIDLAVLEAAMADVRSTPGFAIAAGDIARRLASATLGLDALREKVADRHRAVFADRDAARRVYGQHLAPLDPALGPIERATLNDAVARWWSGGGARLLTVFGGEGVGKSWTVPQWWLRAASADRPILLLAPSDFVRSLPARIEGLAFLAELLAFTLADGTEAARWERRLRRWGAGDPGRRLFLVVLDGLNEATGVGWAGLMDRVDAALAPFGGGMAVTCRRGYWHSELADRMPARMARARVEVGNFDTGELNAAAATRGLDIAPLGNDLRRFISNPRVFSIAAGLVASIGSHELTIPRLLLEFWRHRLAERGDLLVHTDADMRSVIVNHARVLRDGRSEFAVDDWRRHSSRSRRLAGASLDDDLTEVVEGRFFEPDPDRADAYRVRPDTIAFALGLLLVDDLRHAGIDALDQILAEAVEPVGGFDQTGDLLAAAAGIAMLDASVGPRVAATLLVHWLGLQNLEEDSYDAFAAYAGERPTVYLDLVETMHRGHRHMRAMWPVVALRDAIGRPGAADEILARAASWMGWWHLGERFPPMQGVEEAVRLSQERQERRHVDTIAATVEALSDDERAFFDRVCTQVDDRALPEVAAMAPLLLAGMPLKDCVDGLTGWMLALEVGGRGVSGSGMTWIYDTNARDVEATSAATTLAAERLLSIAGCRVVRNAAARLFAMSGTVAGEARSRELYEVPPDLVDFGPWHLHDDYCASDPLDPSSAQPANLVHATGLLAGTDPIHVRSGSGHGAEDGNVDLVTLGLARFDPVPLIAFWRAIVADVARRDMRGVRQLVLDLPGLSPLFDEPCIAAVERLLADLADPAHPLRQPDDVFVAGHLASSLLPHLDGAGQFALLTGLPPDMPWQDDVTELLRPVAPEVFESALRGALAGADTRAAAPILLFAAEGRQPLTPGAADLVQTCLDDDDFWLRALALRTAGATGDVGLLGRLLAGRWTAQGARAYEAHYGSQALIAAAVQARVAMPFERLSTQSHGSAAALGDVMDRAVWSSSLDRRLGHAMARATSQSDEMRFIRRVAATGDDGAYAPFAREPRDHNVDLGALATSPGPFDEPAVADYTERLDALLDGLEAEGLGSLADAAAIAGFDELARERPDELRAMARRISGADGTDLSQTATLGMSMVAALSRIDAALAADLLRRVIDEPGFVRTRIRPAGTPFVLDALFAAVDDAPFAALRDEVARGAPDDRMLARYAVAASGRGKGAWVRDQAIGLIAGSRPAEIALGLTLLGFIDPDPDADAILHRFCDGRGLLATAATRARDALVADGRARHWHGLARDARTPEELWSAGKLMVAAADGRFAVWFGSEPPKDPGTPWALYGRSFLDPLIRRSEKVAGKRRKTLYGSDVPPAQLAVLMGYARES